MSLDRLKETVVLIEDRRFYSHWGVDLIAIIRSLVANLRARRYAQGGSTITQQLVRTMWLYPKKTILRKVVECFLSLKLELTLDKDQIMKLYLSNVYMGHRPNGTEIRGFNEASKYYFQKLLKHTTVAEQAWLVGMLKGPNVYKPKTEWGRVRQVWVLSMMADKGLISVDELKSAVREL